MRKFLRDKDFLTFLEVAEIFNEVSYASFFNSKLEEKNHDEILKTLATLILDRKIFPYVRLAYDFYYKLDPRDTAFLATDFLNNVENSRRYTFIEVLGKLKLINGNSITHINFEPYITLKSLVYKRLDIERFLQDKGYIKSYFTPRQIEIIQSNRVKELKLIKENHSKEKLEIQDENTSLKARITELEQQIKQAQSSQPENDKELTGTSQNAVTKLLYALFSEHHYPLDGAIKGATNEMLVNLTKRYDVAINRGTIAKWLERTNSLKNEIEKS